MFVICSLLLLSSCDKELVKGPGEWEQERRNNFYDYKVKNREGFDMLSITPCAYNEDTAFLTGIKNEKHWIGMFDQQTKKQLQEWNGSETIDREIKIDRGYGEIETMRLSAFHFESDIHKTSWGFVMIPYYTERGSNWGIGMLEAGGYARDILLLNGDKLIVYPLNNPGIVQPHWFQESIVVSSYEYGGEGIDYTVLSPDGKKVVDMKDRPQNWLVEEKNIFPVSYTDGIGLRDWRRDAERCDIRIYRNNYAISETVWETPIPSLLNIKGDARFNITVLEQGNPIWKYRIDVTNRDGSKQQVLFTVNVETGALTEI